jgi:hypothetical protein
MLLSFIYSFGLIPIPPSHTHYDAVPSLHTVSEIAPTEMRENGTLGWSFLRGGHQPQCYVVIQHTQKTAASPPSVATSSRTNEPTGDKKKYSYFHITTTASHRNKRPKREFRHKRRANQATARGADRGGGHLDHLVLILIIPDSGCRSWQV